MACQNSCRASDLGFYPQGSRHREIVLCRAWLGFDLVEQDKVGAGIAASGLGELVAQAGEGLGAPRCGERVEADAQFAVSGVDVAGSGEGFADEGIGLVAGPGVVPVQGAGQRVSAL